jgi:hypothetical protein
MWICGPKALACCLVIAGRGAGRGSRMTLKGESRPFGLLMIGAAVALLAGCTTSNSATVTSTAPSSSSSLSSPSPTVTSTSSPSALPSSVTETKPPVTTATTPWPADLTPDQVASAQAAIAAYVGYYQLVDKAYMAPGSDWTSEVGKWATDPEKSSFLHNMAGTAQLGQYGTGSTVVHPQVTKVEPGLVTMTVCVDSTDAGFFDSAGRSIKAPDAPGSYFRHVSEVQVAKYEGGAWLVTFVTDDYNTTC